MKKKIALIVTSLTVIAVILVNVLVINPNQLKIREVSISCEQIDASFDNFIIACFSDTLLGDTDMKMLEKTVDKINSFSPDIIVFTGDLIEDEKNTDIDTLKTLLNSLDARDSKYAVLGDKDYETSAISILEECGFTILSNKSVQFYKGKDSFINIVGIEPTVNDRSDIDTAYQRVNLSNYTFVFCHTPDIYLFLDKHKSNYVLCGHSLGGQVYIPVISLFSRVEGAKSYFRGITDEGSSTLDITNGIGTRNKKARLWADPEIVILKLNGN